VVRRWQPLAIARCALQEGVARDGSQLFPALPYDHCTKPRNEDIAAQYASFVTRTPVNAPARARRTEL